MKPLQIGIGDLHGHIAALDTLLDNLDLKLHIFGPDKKLLPHIQITFTGDYIDRGENSLAVIQRVMALQEENPEQVHTLCGNHELLALADLDGLASLLDPTNNLVTEEDDIAHYYRYGVHGANGGFAFIKNFGESPQKAAQNYLEAMKRENPIGAWFRRLKVLHQTKSGPKKILFVHGGIPQSLSTPENLEEYAQSVRKSQETKTGVLEKNHTEKYGTENPLFGKESVFWDRTIPKGSQENAQKLTKELLTDFIVIGHTPQRNGIIANYGNRIFNIDIGMSPAYGTNQPGAIVFEDGIPLAFYADRGLTPLLNPPTKKPEPEPEIP